MRSRLLGDLATAIARAGAGALRDTGESESRSVEPYRLVSWARPLVPRRSRRAHRRVDDVPGGLDDAARHRLIAGSSAARCRKATTPTSAARRRVDRLEGARPHHGARARRATCSRGSIPTVGVVEAVDDDHVVLVTGADSFEIMAVYVGMLGLDFTVETPVRPGRPRPGARRALPQSRGLTSSASLA